MKTLSLIFLLSIFLLSACEIMPLNTLPDCQGQCKDSKKSKACYDFCECIHKDGQQLDSCLAKYDKAPADVILKK
ncbi:MAG: hypothetical protein V4721_10100 [Bacteroidota bacterium]